MKKLNRSLVDDHGRVDTSYEIYLGLYQAIMGTEDKEPIYDKFPTDFFDLIVIDECHRGSAAEDSAWREVLDYFDSAIQLGMTATPKETKYVSNIHYFGEPVYTLLAQAGHRGRVPRPLQGGARRPRPRPARVAARGGPGRRRRRARSRTGSTTQGLRPRHRLPRARQGRRRADQRRSCTGPTR